MNINKPVGWTSFDVVKKVRAITKVKKVGHAGTLDPFASGVLLVCTGRATKKIQELMELDKEYVGQIELGTITDTLDITGKVLQKKEVKNYRLSDIQEVCKGFVGEIQQIPPMYSAVKLSGVRLYKLARAGKVVQPKPRTVTVYDIEVLKFDLPFIEIRVRCSKGTYIRALARDIGQRLSCGGYLNSLIRTRVGSFKLEDSLDIE